MSWKDEEYDDDDWNAEMKQFRERHRKKVCPKSKKMNRRDVAKHRLKTKTQKLTDPTYYKGQMRMKERQKRVSRKRCRASRDPAYAHWRFRAILRSVAWQTTHQFRSFFDPEHEQDDVFTGNLDELFKDYRGTTCICEDKHRLGSSCVCEMEDANQVDEIREFVTLSLPYRFFLHPKSTPQNLSVVFNGKANNIDIPSLGAKELFYAKSKSILYHDGILYHNDIRDVSSTDAIIVQPTRKTSKYPNLHQPISLVAFLNEMGIALDNL